MPRPVGSCSDLHLQSMALAAWSLLMPLLLWPSQFAWSHEEEILEQLQASEQRWATQATWQARTDQLREEFLKGAELYPLPTHRPAVPAIRRDYREHDGYSVENVALETFPGFFCTGNLYQPLGRFDRGPIVLCPHGHFQPWGRLRAEHQIRCAHLAQMGATVFSYAMVGWNDSTQTTHDDPFVLQLQTWNSLRAVDFLVSLPRVDPDRIAVTGASGGGTQSVYLALIDSRIKALAPLVILYPWAAPDGCCRCEGGLPIMSAARTNILEIAASLAPRPQLVISVGNDPTRNFPQVGLPFMQRKYEIWNAKNQLQSQHFPEEAHDFGPSKRRALYGFLVEHLQMSPNPFVGQVRTENSQPWWEEDLTTIATEDPAAMMVFDAQHTLPPHALQGTTAIHDALQRSLQEMRSNTQTELATRPSQGTPLVYSPRELGAADEALLFTPPGFDHVGTPQVAQGAHVGQVELMVHDAATRAPTCCRVNVVGPDGNYYFPTDNPLRDHDLTGVWPKSGWGNRAAKAPARYLGHFFYSRGTSRVDVPAGVIRLEIQKGFEYRPVVVHVQVEANRTAKVLVRLESTTSPNDHGYHSGDPHLHLTRRDAEDEQRILDLMEAEGIQYGAVLAYNEPAGPYEGWMQTMDSPQFRGLGARSMVTRGDTAFLSGQEYRSTTYGHLNLFLTSELVRDQQAFNADHWPPFGHVAREARAQGGIAFYAHGGYAQEIYADIAQGLVDGVELLQFGIYRGISLQDWYRWLNIGFRLPASGASDYPACRHLGDCKTYVQLSPEQGIVGWMQGMASGKSFMTSGPLLLLEVDGQLPGGECRLTGQGPFLLPVTVKVRCEVAPVSEVQIIGNGRVLATMSLPPGQGKGAWIELQRTVEVTEPMWIAARAHSLSSLGTPDAEAHTNPVYVYVNQKSRYNRESLDGLLAALDGQIQRHKERKFAEQARVIAFFERSRDILIALRQAGGVACDQHPAELIRDVPELENLSAKSHSDSDLRAFLLPIPPKPIEEVQKSFDAVDGFSLQLLAKEPLVTDPIAGAIDEQGQMYVCEMRDYPFKPQPGQAPLGRVTLLRDVDHDGDFDESHRFADQLLWAGGVACWRGGVFVAAPPDIWYLKDTDGDSRADLRQKVFTGFGLDNQQAMVNNLQWGPDHKIYGCTAGNGGNVHTLALPGRPGPMPGTTPVLDLSGRDFRFDPETGVLEAITGTVQFGNTFDDWGNRFVCSESQPVLQIVLPEQYLSRNPYAPSVAAIENLAPGPVPIHRTSPLERWRMIRSSRRIAHGNRSALVAGASHHVIDAAAGVTIYRGGAYPAKYAGDLFVGDAQNNLIHHRKMSPSGAIFQSVRAEEGTEFVRSSDNWFRPVNLINAPDGTLYVLDMSREILESIHVPLDVAKHLDFTQGREFGRIYRIAPPGYRYPGPPQLHNASTNELVAALDSPHGWYRETAQRLLHQQREQHGTREQRGQMVDEAIRQVMATSKQPQGRLAALETLAGLGVVTDDDLLRGLHDASPWVRRRSLQLSEPHFANSEQLRAAAYALASDTDSHVRLQLMFSLGEIAESKAHNHLFHLARQTCDDRFMRAAALSSVQDQAVNWIAQLWKDPHYDAQSDWQLLASDLLAAVVAQGATDQVTSLLELIASHPQVLSSEQQIAYATRIGRSAQQPGQVDACWQQMTDKSRAWLRQKLDEARRRCQEATEPLEVRVVAIDLLAAWRVDDQLLWSFLNPQQPDDLCCAALRAMGPAKDHETAQRMVANWTWFSPQVAACCLDILLSSQAGTQVLLKEVERGSISLNLLSGSQRALLTAHADPAIEELAKKTLQNGLSPNRQTMIDQYRDAIRSAPDPQKGATIFARECQSCHKFRGIGHAVGPDLSSSSARDVESLLTHMLDPNRYVDPRYVTYSVVDQSGHVYSGIIAQQSASSITLLREQGQSQTVLRAHIDEVASTNLSLMPEGLELRITAEEANHLIGYLLSSSGSDDGEPLDIGTLPGLVAPSISN